MHDQSRILSIELCCLDEHGDLTDELHALNVDDDVAFTFASPLTLAFHSDGHTFTVGTQVYRREPGAVDCVGNLFWRSVRMRLSDARALVAHVLSAHTPDMWTPRGPFADLVLDANRTRRRARLAHAQAVPTA